MTKVSLRFFLAVVLFCSCGISLCTAAPQVSASQQTGQTASAALRPAEATQASATELYRRLRSAGLDPGAVYKIRDGSIDREDIHISLEDGTIAFMQAVDGRVTGAYFEGDGEILLVPPDNVERASLALFTGAAVLEERFTSAFFRFNDDTATQLRPALRSPEDPAAFLAENDRVVRSLAESDALRLLATFLRTAGAPARDDRMFRARLNGAQLGIFDVMFDTLSGEQIAVGKFTRQQDGAYYDVVTSFPMRSARRNTASSDVGQQDTGYSASRGGVRVRRYLIRARIQPPHTLDAQATVDVDIANGGDRLLVFELSRFLRLSRVEAGGRPLEFLQNEALEGTALSRRGNDLVAVIFPQPLRSGEHLQLTFAYAGDVLSEAGGGLMYVGARGVWYPNRGPAMADFDLEFRAPREWTLVATGKRVSERTEGEEQVSRWVSQRPIPLAGFNLGQYSRERAKAGEVEVEAYATRGMEKSFPAPPQAATLPPVIPGVEGIRTARERALVDRLIQPPAPRPAPDRNAERVAETSARTIQFLSRHLGPFPYSSLALSQKPGLSSQGWPGLVFLSSYAFLSREEQEPLKLSPFQSVLFGGFMNMHEVAHQWWGDLVGWKSYRDQWLVEALANYSALMLLEKQSPEQFQTVLEHYRKQLQSKNQQGEELASAGPVTLGQRLSSSHFPFGFEAVSYGRGTWLLHMARHMLRDAATLEKESSRRTGREQRPQGERPDEPFLGVLRGLRERFEGKELSTADLQQALEEELPESLNFERRKSLDWFFRGWVNGTALPRLELDDVKYSRKPSGTVVSGKILQKDAPAELVTSVPVYASMGKNLVLLGRVFADGEQTTFQLRAPAGAGKLVLDPYRTVLTRP